MRTVLVMLAAATHPELGAQWNWDDCDYGFWQREDSKVEEYWLAW